MANSNKKPTIVDNFKDLIAVLKENGLLTEARKEFLEKRIEITKKKNAIAVYTIFLINLQVIIKIGNYIHFVNNFDIYCYIWTFRAILSMYFI